VSITVVGYAFGLSLPSNEKWLLVCLADYADEWGDSIFPTLETLAEKSGMSEDTIKRALRKLIDRGVVERIAMSTPVSPAFYRILGVPEPKKFEKEPTCPPSLRRAAIYLFAARCEYCGQLGTKDLGPDHKPWTIDRVVPGKRGGVYSPDNVALACRFCNTKKRANPAPEGTRTLADLQRGSQQNAPSSTEEQAGNLPAWEGGKSPASEGGTVHPDPLVDPSVDPSSEKAGAAPRPPAEAVEKPDRNIGVITKLAHETYDLLGRGAADGDLTETVKSRCASLGIAYNSDVVRRALDSAKWQREHCGQEALI